MLQTLAIGALALFAVGTLPWLSAKRSEASFPTTSARPAQKDAGTPRGPSPGRSVVVELPLGDSQASFQAVEKAMASSIAPVDSLTIDAFGASFGDAGVERLLGRYPELRPIRLTLLDTNITPRGIAAILASGIPSRLEVLDLRNNLLGVEGARKLADSTRLTHLKELNLGRNHVHAAGAEALAGALRLSALERLELEYNFIGADGVAALVKSTALPRLRDLGLAYNFLKDDGARTLALGRWPNLVTLDVRSNEIGDSGVRALAASTTLDKKIDVWLENNVADSATLDDPVITTRFRIEGAPEFDGRPTLLEEDGFDASKKPPLRIAVAPPAGLPSTVEFRELWIWEFDLVGEFPTFLTPERRPGNGKSRSFTWLDRARLSIGGYWPNEDELSDIVARESKPAPGDRVRVERLNDHTTIVRRTGPNQINVTRWQYSFGAALYVDLHYDSELHEYFAPIAERVLHSLYFDRKHIEEKP